MPSQPPSIPWHGHVVPLDWSADCLTCRGCGEKFHIGVSGTSERLAHEACPAGPHTATPEPKPKKEK
jgi:hypothetical protein